MDKSIIFLLIMHKTQYLADIEHWWLSALVNNNKVSWLLWLFWRIHKSNHYLLVLIMDKSIIYLLIMHKTQFLADSEHEW